MAIVTKAFIKEVLEITGTTYDSRIDLFIPHVEKDFERIRGIDFFEDSNDDVYYPENAEMISAMMVGYKLETTKLNTGTYNDKTSESIGSYSYSKKGNDEMIKGYPKSIVGQIEQYQRFN